MKKERMERAKQRTMMGISSNGERHMEKIMEQAMKTLSEARKKRKAIQARIQNILKTIE
jgi:hypothetical protein